ncbi:MAG: carbohydrate ABC transporter permease [Candidatus Omnitrophica bacterium]|nr:carbohydrate ABC transporter permease [Candidatus Omnitrophota bacterium]
MKRAPFANSFVALLLFVIVICTLTPLFLMFQTSLKSAGTLTGSVKKITLIADQSITDKYPLRLNLDVRKFKNISILFGNYSKEDYLEITFSDAQGRSCSVYKRAGPRLTIPISDFDIKALNPGLPERLAETITISLKNNNNPVFIKELSLTIKRLTLANYWDIIITGYFGRYFFNSLLIAVAVTLGNIFFCTIVGYAFARKRFAFKNFLFLLIMAGIMIPPQVLIVPIFIMMKNIGWLNTYWALIVPSLVQPFGIFLMRQYISRLPASLEDQARVDGATDRQIIFKIIFPLSRPALAIIGINTFMGSWNTFLFPFILTDTARMRTLPVGLALFKNLQGADWVHLMAASSMTALPIIIIFLGFQKHIIAGLTTGLVKR